MFVLFSIQPQPIMKEITMSKTQTETTVEPVEIDPIVTAYRGESSSISGRSVIFWELGRHSKEATLHLRILSSSGGGMVCKDWVEASKIDAVLISAEVITGKSLQILQKGRSINFGPYAMAVCKDLGCIHANAENSRLHEHVPTTTFTQLAMTRVGQAGEVTAKPGRRKAKEV